MFFNILALLKITMLYVRYVIFVTYFAYRRDYGYRKSKRIKFDLEEFEEALMELGESTASRYFFIFFR